MSPFDIIDGSVVSLCGAQCLILYLIITNPMLRRTVVHEPHNKIRQHPSPGALWFAHTILGFFPILNGFCGCGSVPFRNLS
ncbi:hypothetical protein B0H34DRAFT_29674 [Crassisporium funariophilum]|nr:hypothetical protein B0H34DRAFT_29674 [Crassisporium funariophilum]